MKLSNVLPRVIYAIPLFVTVALLACASQTTPDPTPEIEPTPVVEPTATPSPAPTPTAVPTATPEPEEEQQPPIEIPDRGYNAVGSPDAPVTMFDFSDFT